MQVASDWLEILPTIPGISVTLTTTVPIQPMSDVMVQVYVPALKPTAVAVVCAIGSSHWYVIFPSTGCISAVAVPSLPPGQDTRVVVPVNVAGVSPTVTFAEEEQPNASVICTVYVPALTLFTVCVVAPPNPGHTYEYGARPEVGFAVIEPIPDEQISGVLVAVTEDATPVIHVVSDAPPTLLLHDCADNVRK